MPSNATHLKYEAAVEALAAASVAVREFAESDKENRFEWEIGETSRNLGVAIRTFGKPGEVLYCNWRDCLHAKGEGAMVDGKRDRLGRALLPGEGVAWFKGRVHPDCMEAINNR